MAALVPLAALLWGTGAASAGSRQRMRSVTYHGYSLTVPRAWPIYNLADSPHTCVRFNRHALYLGRPGPEQRCPAQAIGRTEAILVEPTGAGAARARIGQAGAGPVAGDASTLVVPSAGVIVVATWLHDPRLIAAALHRRALPEAKPARLRAHLLARSSGGGAPIPASTYTGPGFDTCDAPSAQDMAAWTSYSPYHAIGIYIGGANAACPPSLDPNLTPTWLANEASAGWHFIPTYVGLQAPSNSCGCAPIKATQATSEGTAAADDAVTQAQSLDLPSGTPIYNDMEYYSRTQSNTSAVLAFLAAWTSELHAKGYLSGVYGNANSAIADLVTQYGTSYPEPDDIWFAAWPGEGTQTTSDPNIPSSDWANHQRLHQYSGAHDETYGGVKLNIDGDYLDGATATTIAAAAPPPPALVVAPAGAVTNLTTSWNGLGLARWEVLAGESPTTLTAIKSAPLHGGQTHIAVRSAAPYFGVQAIGSSGQVLAVSAAAASPSRLELFGRSSFFGESSGVGGLPVGCYLPTSCQIVATISAGRTRLTRTQPQTFRAGGSGVLHYRLTSTGRRLLAKARGARLPVQVKLKDVSGISTSTGMTLIPFTTSGRGPGRSLSGSAPVAAAGTTEFVYRGSWGGILTRCSSVPACWVTATLMVGRRTIASAAPQLVGGLELGYVYFTLTTQGRRLLSSSRGNQLATTLLLRSGTSTASARIALVQYF
jgi:glycoside hydrolase-like protein